MESEPFGRWEWKRDSGVMLLIGAVLLVHFVVVMDCARKMTVTHDEYWHIPVGLLSWKTGRFDLDTLNPPLIRLWGALPLISASPGKMPAEALPDPAGYGDAFLAADPDHYHTYVVRARIMIAILSVFTGVILSIWARRLFGPIAACLTVLLWACCPNVIANAALVTTDLGAALMFLIALFVLWNAAHRPTWRGTVGLGICLGLAQLAKFTSLLLYPICLLLWWVVRVRNDRVKRPALGVVIGQSLVALAVSILVLNAGYLFEGTGSSVGSYRFESRAMAMLSRLPPSLPLLFPRDYLVGLDRQQHIMESPHPIYLDGEWGTSGFRSYYLKVLLDKLPHPFQGLLLLAGAMLIWPGRERRFGRVQAFLLIPVVLLLVIASMAHMQLGLRYVLPVIPLLMLFAGQTARWFDWKRFPARTFCVALVVLLIPSSLRFHPHHLSYFNELAGGPVGGRQHLLDSNLDWGQDLRELKSYLDLHSISDVGLAYYGTLPPAALGIRYHLPPAHFPQPGWYAISVNFVQGRPHLLRKMDGERQPVDIDAFGYFRFFTPAARIGYSIDVYRITPEDIARLQAARRRAGM